MKPEIIHFNVIIGLIGVGFALLVWLLILVMMHSEQSQFIADTSRQIKSNQVIIIENQKSLTEIKTILKDISR